MATKKTKRLWHLTKASNACVDIRVDSFRRRNDWQFWVLLTTDRHWDNPDSDWDLQRKHLDQAAERDWPVIDNGDFFCCMQGKYDKRASKDKLRPEHQNGRYFDSLVKTASDFFGPYASQFAVIGEGNHETSITKRHETDLIERLVSSLNTNHGGQIEKGGYGSWVRFLFYDGQSRFVVKMKRYHGHGGGGPVTKGVIQTNRRAAYLSDADIVFTGHVHEDWRLVIMREHLTTGGNVQHRKQLHICGATYKDEYKDGSGGWHIETGKPPKPIGAVWLKFWFDGKKSQIQFDAVTAQ